MKRQSFDFLKVLIPFSLLLYVAQFFIVNRVFSEFTFFYSTWSIYLFHFSVTICLYFILLIVHRSSAEKTGMAFLAGSVLKMMLSVLFLIPLIKSEMELKLPDVGAFFIPYFLFLILETAFALRLINKE